MEKKEIVTNTGKTIQNGTVLGFVQDVAVKDTTVEIYAENVTLNLVNPAVK